MSDRTGPDGDPPWLLELRRGASPNCSATGSVVGMALVSFTLAAAVLNAWGDRFSRWLTPPRAAPDAPPGPPDAAEPPEVTVRREAFGGVVAWARPPALLLVDTPTLDAALARGARAVGGAAAPPGALSAPLEVHLALTSRCAVRCTACYLDAGPEGEDADGTALDADLVALAAQGVLRVALGGGEVLAHPHLLPVCRRIRDLGMEVALTTSGLGMTSTLATALAPLVRQVNVSLDGVAGVDHAVRGWSGEATARRALALLQEAGVPTGVNTVLTRASLDGLDLLADLLVTEGVREWQWLRLKPAGRGAAAWEQMTPTPGQVALVWPKLLELEARTGLTIRVDCALVPWLSGYHQDPGLARRLGVSGCPGGHSLAARTPEGRWAPCSFDHAHAEAHPGPAEAWRDSLRLAAWRSRAASPPAPCDDCGLREVCRGGCRVVAEHLTGDALAPDPECPRVRAWRAA